MFGLRLYGQMLFEFGAESGVSFFGQLPLCFPQLIIWVLEILHQLITQTVSHYYMQSDSQFQHVVPENHPYHKLLSACLPRLNHIFDIQANDHLSPLEALFPLKMYCRENADVKYATFIYFFTLPVTSEQYLGLLKNLELQKQLDSYMDEYKIYKDLNVENTEVLYLAYKKVLIVNPRYFIYVRYHFTINGETWIVAISDPEAESIKDKTKAEIVLSVTRVREVEGGCQISVFSQTDMKMNLKFETAKQKGFSQIKKYLEKVYQAFKK